MTDEIDKIMRLSKPVGILGSDPFGSVSQAESFLTQELKQSKMLSDALGVTGSLARMVRDANIFSTMDLLGGPTSRAMSAALASQRVLTDLTFLLSTTSASLRSRQIPQFGMVQQHIDALNSARFILHNTSLPEHGIGLHARSFSDASASYKSLIDITRGGSFYPTAAMDQGSILADLSQLYRAIDGVPPWMRPLSTIQAFQASWELAAGLGVSGLGRAGLIQDLLATLHSARMPTAGFEATAQMLEAADEDAGQLVERILYILQTHAAPIIELLGQAKDWVQHQGVVAIVGLMISVCAYYETEQQTRLARLASEPSAAQREIGQHVANIDKVLSQSQQNQAAGRDERIVIHAAPLRRAPDAKGAVLRQIFPDDRVRVTAVQGGWARVEVYEYNSEKLTDGWINRQVLRISNR